MSYYENLQIRRFICFPGVPLQAFFNNVECSNIVTKFFLNLKIIWLTTMYNPQLLDEILKSRQTRIENCHAQIIWVKSIWAHPCLKKYS